MENRGIVIIINPAGHSGHISNYLRPDLVPKLRELLVKSESL
jgi:hypothetical protein